MLVRVSVCLHLCMRDYFLVLILMNVISYGLFPVCRSTLIFSRSLLPGLIRRRARRGPLLRRARLALPGFTDQSTASWPCASSSTVAETSAAAAPAAGVYMNIQNYFLLLLRLSVSLASYLVLASVCECSCILTLLYPHLFFFPLSAQFTVALPFHSEGLGLEVSMSDNEAHIVVTGFVRKQMHLPNPPSQLRVPATAAAAAAAANAYSAAHANAAAYAVVPNTSAVPTSVRAGGAMPGSGPPQAAATPAAIAASAGMKQAELSGLIQVLVSLCLRVPAQCIAKYSLGTLRCTITLCCLCLHEHSACILRSLMTHYCKAFSSVFFPLIPQLLRP